MIQLKTFERTPGLAELKVSYKRRRPSDNAQVKMPWVVSAPVDAVNYLRSVWDKDRLEFIEEMYLVCLNTRLEVLGWVKVAQGGLAAAPVDPRVIFGVALKTLTNYANHIAKPAVNEQFAAFLPKWSRAA